MWMNLIARRWRRFKWKLNHREPYSRLTAMNQLSSSRQCMTQTFYYNQSCKHACFYCPADDRNNNTRVLSKRLTCPN
ncbi:hypothetical protein VPHD292_0079 [Vibrio phage D292]